MKIEVPEGYESLGAAFEAALHQAAHGKGQDRHGAGGLSQDDQIIGRVPRMMPLLAGLGGLVYQVGKKVVESTRLLEMDKGKPSRPQDELLGAMVYAGRAWVLLEQSKGEG